MAPQLTTQPRQSSMVALRHSGYAQWSDIPGNALLVTAVSTAPTVDRVP
jgi:hypothetical protein